MSLIRFLLAALAVCTAMPAVAAPVSYEIDPDHTYPSFEADHMGMSVWRGKFNRTAGMVTLDRQGGTGTLAIDIDLASIDFGQEQLNELMSGTEYFDTARHPKANYKGRLVRFVDGSPTRAIGELTLRGVTRPVTLDIKSFKCMPHPIFKRDWCGADVYARINREEFGIDEGKEWGFAMDVDLRIQVEAVAMKQGATTP
jgi:polyisoprenoid-binding protein YceI